MNEVPDRHEPETRLHPRAAAAASTLCEACSVSGRWLRREPTGAVPGLEQLKTVDDKPPICISHQHPVRGRSDVEGIRDGEHKAVG